MYRRALGGPFYMCSYALAGLVSMCRRALGGLFYMSVLGVL